MLSISTWYLEIELSVTTAIFVVGLSSIFMVNRSVQTQSDSRWPETNFGTRMGIV